MSEIRYLKWLSEKTITSWWHDSADPDEITVGIENGAVGTTVNPVLLKEALHSRSDIWGPLVSCIPRESNGAVRAEEISRVIITNIASRFFPIFERTHGLQGYVCAQVNPKVPGDAEAMIEMAKRLNSWAANIAVKLPATAAGLDALEECAAEGMTITATISFSVAQVIAIAERYRKALRRAIRAGIKPGRCFAVIMIGRVDDYIRDVASDSRAEVTESDIIQAGLAVTKRAYEVFEERGYEAVLMPAAMRGSYHAIELAGAGMVFSIHPRIQSLIAKIDEPWDERIHMPISEDVIRRLKQMPDFVRAYEPEGMIPQEFITYGLVQKTLSQFIAGGWACLEEYAPK